MARTNRGRAIKDVCTLFEAGSLGRLTDGELLERFLAHDRDTAEASFAAIVDRHGPMVLRVCSMVLRNDHDALDAFQASFLILVHKARALRVRDSLGPWLHQVAMRVASCARSVDLRRRKHERAAAELNTDRAREHREDVELASVLHSESDRLPDRYRRPIVLCCVAGLSREQAVLELGWPVGTVQSRLARGRERLRGRLSQRGIGAPAIAACVSALAAKVSRRGCAKGTGGSCCSGGCSRGLERFSDSWIDFDGGSHIDRRSAENDVIDAFEDGRGRGCGDWFDSRRWWNLGEPENRIRGTTFGERGVKAAHFERVIPAVVARVNDVSITRDQLAERCLTKYGSRELQTLISMVVIDNACAARHHRYG